MDTRITTHQARTIAAKTEEIEPNLRITKPMIQQIAEFGLFVAWLCFVLPIAGLAFAFFWAILKFMVGH